jgi:hypothetical protein
MRCPRHAPLFPDDPPIRIQHSAQPVLAARNLVGARSASGMAAGGHAQRLVRASATVSAIDNTEAAQRVPTQLSAPPTEGSPEMGANVFSRPSTQRDPVKMHTQVEPSPFDSVRR